MEENIKFMIEKGYSNRLDKNEVKIKIETSYDNKEIDKFIKYIEEYEKIRLYILDGNQLTNIDVNDILYFYSDKKYNYCRTLEKEFKIKSKLYEIEKLNINFLRISKSCIINIKQVTHFDLSETNKIVVKFRDNSTQFVSRRKLKEVMNYLKGRRI